MYLKISISGGWYSICFKDIIINIVVIFYEANNKRDVCKAFSQNSIMFSFVGCMC